MSLPTQARALGHRLGLERRPRVPGIAQGFLLGAIGSNLGLAAMTLYQVFVAPKVPGASGEAHGPLDSISVAGENYEEGESSTAATGRIAFRQAEGRDPRSDATKTALSYGVHWSYGMLVGGLYGAARAGRADPDLGVGLAYSVGLWAFGDELAVPILGLQAGPTASTPAQHANRLAAHLLFGVGLAIGTQTLAKAIGRRA